MFLAEYLIPGDEFARRPKPSYLWDGLVRKNALNIFWGHPGSGKSYVALRLGCAVASDQESFLGKDILIHGTVAHLPLEDPDTDADRMPDPPPDSWYAYDGPSFSLYHIARNKDSTQQLLYSLEEIDLLIIDSYSAGAGVPSENDSTYTQDVCNLLWKCCKKGTTIILIVHLNKDEPAGDNVLRGRGSIALAASASNIVCFTKRGDIYQLTLPKNRIGPEESDLAFKITSSGPQRFTGKLGRVRT
jgi:hypothetical protein